ncbi:hypothetical protein GWI33_012092 [Rhynchophorus ferrugineus]|uniref:Uncharacterized protein n=1 Tax=Rhynchophorus ferrugineus TaxID=354439 RepID=A0A834IA09_RHYFE|nr:hypothetical protein GWI33_012092 [Rhynchophorus ferrugineus]
MIFTGSTGRVSRPQSRPKPAADTLSKPPSFATTIPSPMLTTLYGNSHGNRPRKTGRPKLSKGRRRGGGCVTAPAVFVGGGSDGVLSGRSGDK